MKVQMSDKIGVHQLLNKFKEYGVDTLVFSPGSRNAPLVISFTNDPFFNCYVIPDERSASFYALGMADVLNKPVAVLCTSGSAVVNYYPAVVEAFYRNVPLVIVSADRPKELIDHGHGQTIRQENIFANHILGELSLIEHPSDEAMKQNDTGLEHILQEALSQNGGGPVHINTPFSEPLYNTVEVSVKELDEVSNPTNSLSSVLDTIDFSALAKEWSSYKKIMIICGQSHPDERLNHVLNEFASDTGVAVLIENTSNLSGRNFISCIDRTLNSISSEEKEWYEPDLLISIGGAIVSKRIKAFLKDKPIAHWKIGAAFPKMDTYEVLSKSFPLAPIDFFNQLKKEQLIYNKSRFGEQWKQLDYLVQDRHFAALNSLPFSDMQVFAWLMDVLPEKSMLHMSNSSVVRYCQLFDPIASVRYFANRGTSGIDGSTSTAIGAALAAPDKLHVFVTGDISFFYDSNAFWNNHVPSNLKIILINNGGGGIFKIIPGPDTTSALEDYFVTKHDFNAEHICKAFRLGYCSAKNMQDLDEVLPDFFNANKKKLEVLEVFTPYEENHKVLKAYFNKISVKAHQLKEE